MAADFTPIFTRAGLAALRNAQSSGLQASIAALAIGKGAASGQGFVGYVPTGNETALKNEIARAPILSGVPIGGVDGAGAIGFEVVALFPALAPASAATAILEIGVFLDDGTLLCVLSSPDVADVLGSITAFASLELAFDLYLTAVDITGLAITVQNLGAPDNLACLAELLRGVARNYTRQMRATHRLARRGIRE